MSVFHIITLCKAVGVNELMFWGCLFGHFGSQKGGEGRRGAAFPEDFPPRSRKVELLAGHQPLSLALAWFPVEESTCLPCSLQSEALALDTLSLSFCLVLFDFVGFSRLMFLLRSLPLPCCFFRPIYYLPTLPPISLFPEALAQECPASLANGASQA